MKKLLILFVMAGLLFTSCNKNKWIETDYSDDVVGTWTCLEAGYAEALVINADGTIVSTGVENDVYWEDVKGTYEIVNNKMTMKFEDNDNFEGRFEMIPGETLVLIEEDGERNTYRYCTEDLSEEIVGMWVFQDGVDTTIQTVTEDGKLITTASASDLHADNLVQQVSEYKVVGDLRFHIFLEETIDHDRYLPVRLVYTPKGTALGDIMSVTFYAPIGNDFVEMTRSSLRVKQGLNFGNNKKYDYSAAYVSNVNGTDEDFTIMGNTFNISNIDNGDFDVILGSRLFYVEFPNANTMKHKYRLNDQDVEFEVPITVEDNKVTLDMSAVNPAYRKVDMYMFQDVDDTQLHMYMPTYAFINYFANLELATLLSEGEIDTSDAAAVEKIFADMEARIESINVSFVMKARQ